MLIVKANYYVFILSLRLIKKCPAHMHKANGPGMFGYSVLRARQQGARQQDGGPGSDIFAADHFNGAAVSIDNPFHNCEAETRSAGLSGP